ncbi:MAG: hypothetical protein RLZZ283_223 [Candidatus Parcubacteria bacterium]|jgi:hypothetical protein
MDVGEYLRLAVSLVLGLGSDAAILGGLVIVAFGIAFLLGRDHIPALIAGSYAAALMYTAFPFTSILMGDAYISIAFFLVLTALASVGFSGMSSFFASGMGLFSTMVLCVLAAGLVASSALTHIPEIQTIYTPSSLGLMLFSGQAYFWWLVTPIAGLVFFGRG